MIERVISFGVILLAVAGTILAKGTQALDMYPNERAVPLVESVISPLPHDSGTVILARKKESFQEGSRLYKKTPQVDVMSKDPGQGIQDQLTTLVDKYRLVQDENRYFLHSDKGRILSIPSAWLTQIGKVEDPLDELMQEDKVEFQEEETLASSIKFDEPVTTFPIGDGRLGLQVSSYEIQKEGSGGAATGRDVFLVFDPQAGRIHPGGLLSGVTKERARYRGLFFALSHRFFIGDINEDGLTDIGVIREEIKPTGPDRDIPSGAEYKKHRIWWFVYGRGRWTPFGRRDHWEYEAALDGKIPKTKMVQLPLIGIVKTPVAFVKELSGGKLQRSRDRIRRPGQKTMVLWYGDFGPQVCAHEVLGMEWYQWNLTGSPNPDEFDPIQVVVYRDIELDVVKQLYPVVKELSQDYRYISYQEALNYLNKNMATFNDATSLLSRFSETRHRIIETLNGMGDKN